MSLMLACIIWDPISKAANVWKHQALLDMKSGPLTKGENQCLLPKVILIILIFMEWIETLGSYTNVDGGGVRVARFRILSFTFNDNYTLRNRNAFSFARRRKALWEVSLLLQSGALSHSGVLPLPSSNVAPITHFLLHSGPISPKHLNTLSLAVFKYVIIESQSSPSLSEGSTATKWRQTGKTYINFITCIGWNQDVGQSVNN